MKKYRASTGFNTGLRVVDCDRETASSVWIEGRRHAKETESECFFDSFDEAQAWLVVYYAGKKARLLTRAKFYANLEANAIAMCDPEKGGTV